MLQQTELENTPGGTRARNLRIRSPTPCPLGHGGLKSHKPDDDMHDEISVASMCDSECMNDPMSV